MAFGRLVRLSKYRGDPNAIAYLIAIPQPEEAISVIRQNVGELDDEIEDLGRVSHSLLQALDLSPGEFVRVGDLAKRGPLR